MTVTCVTPYLHSICTIKIMDISMYVSRRNSIFYIMHFNIMNYFGTFIIL